MWTNDQMDWCTYMTYVRGTIRDYMNVLKNRARNR
jgi:hypothetical protein